MQLNEFCEGFMETYVDVILSADGEKASIVHGKLIKLGLKPTIGDHDFFYAWKGIVTMDEELAFINRIQDGLKGTGVMLKFCSVR